MEPEWGFEPGSAEYKATALPFELSSIDSSIKVNGNSIELTVHTSCYSVQTYSVLIATNSIKFIVLYTWAESHQALLSQFSLLAEFFFEKLPIKTLRVLNLMNLDKVTGEVPGSNPGKGENFSVKISNWIVRI